MGGLRAPPMLLTMPHYAGTLAAVRCLGEHGIPVTVASDRVLAAARWSRHATRSVRCPPVAEPGEFLAWLLDFGHREPGHVLYPTCDDLAWLFAANAASLSKVYRMYQPPLATMVQLLNKKRLTEACAEAGIETLPTWFPNDDAEVEALTDRLPLPLLIKARTHVLRSRQTKGMVVRSREEVLPAYRRFVETDRYLPGHERDFIDATRPLLQEFHTGAAQAVYSISGFIDPSGELFEARGSVKVLQRTEPVGLGVCFESAPVEAPLAEAVARLCRNIGYFGAFEVEFLREGTRRLAIDFNPRFYGQMAFDVKRGLPLPLLVWLGACGLDGELREQVAAAAAVRSGEGAIYLSRFVFELLLLSRRLTGRLSSTDRRRWRNWFQDRRGQAIDAAREEGDWLPGAVHVADELRRGPSAFLRAIRGG